MADLTTVAGRLLWARERKQWSQSDLARRMGVTPGAVSQIETETSKGFSAQNLAKAALALEVDPIWLAIGQGEPGGAGIDRYAMIPRLDVEAAAGAGSDNGFTEVQGTVAFRREWLAERGLSPADLRVISASGDSMSPRIENGDTVLIDVRDQGVVSGRIYLLDHPDGLRIKRLRREIDGSLVIASDSADKARYPDERITAATAAHLRIIGRVVWVGANL